MIPSAELGRTPPSLAGVARFFFFHLEHFARLVDGRIRPRLTELISVPSWVSSRGNTSQIIIWASLRIVLPFAQLTLRQYVVLGLQVLEKTFGVISKSV